MYLDIAVILSPDDEVVRYLYHMRSEVTKIVLVQPIKSSKLKFSRLLIEFFLIRSISDKDINLVSVENYIAATNQLVTKVFQLFKS